MSRFFFLLLVQRQRIDEICQSPYCIGKLAKKPDRLKCDQSAEDPGRKSEHSEVSSMSRAKRSMLGRGLDGPLRKMTVYISSLLSVAVELSQKFFQGGGWKVRIENIRNDHHSETSFVKLLAKVGVKASWQEFIFPSKSLECLASHYQ